MEILNYLSEKYSLDLNKPSPIEIPNVGRNDMAKWFYDWNFMVGAEIGVEEGKFSTVLCDANPNAKLYCVDSWQPYPEYRASLVNGDGLYRAFEDTKERLKGRNVEFVRAYSMDAVKKFKNDSLDYVYIDANHELPYCMDDLVYWSEKVKPGGIIAGHDYIKYGNYKKYVCHVKEAVGWYTKIKGNQWFLIGRKNAPEGEYRDLVRSFMWIKE